LYLTIHNQYPWSLITVLMWHIGE